MSCTQVRKRLPLYVGGDLPAEEAARVAEHLAGCAACQAEAQSYEASLAALRAAGRAAPPPGDWRACWRAVEAGLTGSDAPRRGRITPFPRRVWPRLRAAAAFLAAVGLGVLAGRAWRPAETPRPAAASRLAEAPSPAATATVSAKPEEKLLTIEDVLRRSAPAEPTYYRAAPVRLTGGRRGYYMDNIELVGAR